MAAGPFDLSHAPPVGVPETLAPGLRVVTAPNAGPMTFTGTRSYVLGEGEVAVIDPGPDDPRHLAALAAAVEGRAGGGGPRHPRPPRPQRRRPRLRRAGGRARPRPRRPRRARARPAMARLAAAGGIGGGEGIDAGFRPDRPIAEGEVLAGPGWTLTALATPGHTADHLSFAWAEGERALLRRPRHGLGHDADLAAGRRPRRLPHEPRPAPGPPRDRLLPRPRRADRRPAGDHGARAGAPGHARGGDPRRPGPRAGDRGRRSSP